MSKAARRHNPSKDHDRRNNGPSRPSSLQASSHLPPYSPSPTCSTQHTWPPIPPRPPGRGALRAIPQKSRHKQPAAHTFRSLCPPPSPHRRPPPHPNTHTSPLNSWPRWPPHLAHVISTRFMPCVLSVMRSTEPGISA